MHCNAVLYSTMHMMQCMFGMHHTMHCDPNAYASVRVLVLNPNKEYKIYRRISTLLFSSK